jgi:PAS domain S-box-containing protein
MRTPREKDVCAAPAADKTGRAGRYGRFASKPPPYAYFLSTILLIFLCEFLVMAFIGGTSWTSRQSTLGAALLALLAAPLLYYSLFRPLERKNLELAKSGEELEALNRVLDEKIHRLQEAESEYESLVNAIPDIVYKIDPDGNFTFINEAVEMLGYTPEELIGKHFSKIISPEEIEYISRGAVLPKYEAGRPGTTKQPGTPKLFDERRSGGRATLGLEVHILRKKTPDRIQNDGDNPDDGDDVIVGEVNSSGVYRLDRGGAGRELVGTLGIIKTPRVLSSSGGTSGVIRDITKRKREVDGLIRLKKMMEDVTQGVSESMSLLTEDYKILWANKATQINTGYKLEDIVGRHCYEITHRRDTPCDSPLDPCPLKEMKTTGTPATMCHTHFDKQGQKRYVEVTVYPIGDDDGDARRYVYVSKDVTETKRLTEELYRLNKDLELRVEEETQKREDGDHLLIQQSRMASLGEMVGIIAHQWRQPLNVISLMAHDIKDAFKFGEVNQAYVDNTARTIKNQTGFMSKTISDFINFLKPARTKVRFDAADAIAGLTGMFTDFFIKQNIRISINRGEGEKFPLLGYPNEFKQVVLNIINNAADSISSRRETDKDMVEGLITFGLEKSGKSLIITIKDNGGGIADEIMGKIFDPYFTTKSGDKGTGIGLYMSKTIIENNMGGRLYCENAPGGAVFTIELERAG